MRNTQKDRSSLLPMSLTIFSDDEHEGKWFQSLSNKLNDTPIVILGKRGSNPPLIEKLLRYDRPDIILVDDKKPVLVLEKTREVPTGHNVGQRFGRIVCAAEENVPTIFYIPFIAQKHGKYAGACSIPARLFLAFKRMEEIHEIPILAIEWPSDKNNELINDGTEEKELSEFVDELISKKFDHKQCISIKNIHEKTNQTISNCTPGTEKPPPSVKIINTKDYIKYLEKNFPDKINLITNTFKKREKTLIYTNEMTEDNCRREDPYTGQQFIYDYMECRNGKNVTDKHSNLVLKSPLVSIERWIEANPNDPERKSALWYATADIIELKDGFIVAKSKIGKNYGIS